MKISLLKTLIITLFTINIALAQVNRVKENPFSFETSYIDEAFIILMAELKRAELISVWQIL